MLRPLAGLSWAASEDRSLGEAFRYCPLRQRRKAAGTASTWTYAWAVDGNGRKL